MQNDIVKSDRPVVPMGSALLIANCQKLLVRARQVGMPVIYVQVIRRQDGKDAPRPPFGTAAASLRHRRDRRRTGSGGGHFRSPSGVGAGTAAGRSGSQQTHHQSLQYHGH
ncbi:MAG: hypothetical protein IH870_01250 [Chloroflexi bacterium]|nr:hypothetical protein [Chloroflexota bacterium]